MPLTGDDMETYESAWQAYFQRTKISSVEQQRNLQMLVVGLFYAIAHYYRQLIELRESTAVPENVYIIATMNTADKHIAVLDTALRRWFAFRELMPDLELLSGVVISGIPLYGLPVSLNERIVGVLDRNL